MTFFSQRSTIKLMPASSLKIFRFLFLSISVVALNLPFLLNPTPAQASFNVCSDNLNFERAELSLTPYRIGPGDNMALDFSFSGFNPDSRLGAGATFPSIAWDVWVTTPNSGTAAPLPANRGWARFWRSINQTITTDPGAAIHTQNGNIVPYAGHATITGLSEYGLYKIEVVKPRYTSPSVDISDQITCNKSVGFTVVPRESLPLGEIPDTKVHDSGAGSCANLAIGISSCPKLSEFVNRILSIALGSFGGIAFLLLIYGGLRLVASQGDPKALQEARTIITAAITGLLFAIFAVFILRLLGIGILGLPL